MGNCRLPLVTFHMSLKKQNYYLCGYARSSTIISVGMLAWNPPGTQAETRRLGQLLEETNEASCRRNSYVSPIFQLILNMILSPPLL